MCIRDREITFLSKDLLPLPEKFHGLTDVELRYRMRYVDLLDVEVRQVFVKRCLLYTSYYLRLIVRMYMHEPQSEAPVPPIRMGVGLAIALSLAATLWLGILPNTVLHYTQGTQTFLSGW